MIHHRSKLLEVKLGIIEEHEAELKHRLQTLQKEITTLEQQPATDEEIMIVDKIKEFEAIKASAERTQLKAEQYLSQVETVELES